MNASRKSPLKLLGAAALAGTALCAQAAQADDVADFYRGKTLTIIVGYSAGGGYDVNARALSRHIGRHIPGNPNVIVTNMPGAGSLASVNFLYNVAPKDGTSMGTFGRGIPMEPLIGSGKFQFEATKLNWIGSVSAELSVCAVTQKSKVRTFEDTLTTEIAMGGEAAGSDPDTYANLVRALTGAKLKLVTGYPGGNDMALAAERGELDGRCGWSWGSVKATRPAWVSGPDALRVLLQMSVERSPEMPNVPTIYEKAKTDADRQVVKLIVSRQTIARPFAAPPNVPADRVAALRAAFAATMKDKEFLAEADKQKLEVDPVSGADVQKLIEDIYKSSPDVIARAKEVMAAGPAASVAKPK
ncbi:MAG: Bug family tripartite tricarboxylate transporter substrate binding protein [Beijerinckiaceae bacterium]